VIGLKLKYKNKSLIIFIVVLLLLAAARLIPVKPLLINNNVLYAEVASTPRQRAQGLQKREYLAPNKGMLFCFEREDYYAFWMHNTPLALDIAFLGSDKKIVDIQHMKPLDPEPRYLPKNKAKYALEVNAGYFKEKNISVGDRVYFW
jgi:uncharacterized membrane protein (UPF0127 family)